MLKSHLPLLLLLAPISSQAVMSASQVVQHSAVVPGQVLVRFKPEHSSALQASALGSIRPAGLGTAAMALKARLGLETGDSMLSGQIERLRLPGYMRVEDAVAQLVADPAVQWAEPVFVRKPHVVSPNDPCFSEQWPLANTGQTETFKACTPSAGGTVGAAGTPGADMALTRAWDSKNIGIADRTDSSSVRLALVDDGFELTHPDLNSNFNIPLGHDFHTDGSEDGDPSPVTSADTHGTLVAGAAGAVGNNGIGISGPAWRTQIIPIRFGYDSGSEVKAFDYARANGAKVVNASFGGPEFSKAEFDAIDALRAADILLVASAGNFDSNTDFAKRAYPANYDLGNIVAVAASNRTDSLTGFSQYGPITVDVAAPGSRILTTSVGRTYQAVSGTSFSAPYTAGVAALIRATYPSADYRETKARLIEGAAAGNGLRSFTTGGRVDANASLNLAARPSLVIQSLSFDDTASGDSDGALDPGESAVAVVSLQNLWSAASNLSVTLSSGSSNVTASATPQLITSIAKGGSSSLRFPITVAAGAKAHEIVDFTLQISGAGYNAVRHFNAELGRLDKGVVTNAAFGGGLRDEFHTWQFDLPSLPVGDNQLVVSSTADSDIDIIVKRGSPPEYEISLGVDPESSSQTFSTDAPAAQIGGSKTGNETVTINNPATGTWFVTVVNYTQNSNVPYTLLFKTQAGAVAAPAPASGGGGGGGGGAFFGFPLLAALLRRKRR